MKDAFQKMLADWKLQWVFFKDGLERRLILFGIMLFVILVFPLAILRWTGAIVTNAEKAWNISKAFDRAGNVLLNGDWREMISTRAGRSMKEGRTWACVLCRLLDKVDPNHCEESKE